MFRTKLKNAFAEKRNKIALSTIACLSMVSPAYAIDPDVAARNVLKFLFGTFLFGGIILAAYGVYVLVKAAQEGENAPPGAIGKGIGLLLGGLVLAASQFIVEKLFGVDIDTFSLFS